MTGRKNRSSRRPLVVVVVVAAVALTLCAQSLQGLLRPATAAGSGVEAVNPASVGEFEVAKPPAPNGFAGPRYDRAVTATPTGDGDASQVWFADGRWWGVLTSSATDEFHIWAYDRAGQAWVDTGTLVDDRPNVRPDVLWDGTSLYVVSGGRRSYRSDNVRVSRFSYDVAARRWTADPDFPVSVSDIGAGDPLIAREPDGTLWLSYLQDGRVMVARTDGNGAVWTSPAVMPGQEHGELVSAVSMTGHADGVSVVWVPRHTDELRVTTHRTGTPGELWSSTTRSIYGLGGVDGPSKLDDRTPTELSLRAFGEGPDHRLFVAFQTSLAKLGSNEFDPHILLATIDASGYTTTTMVAEVADHHSHPVVAIDAERQQILVMATSPDQLGGVYVKRASLSRPVFAQGIGEPAIYGDGLYTVDHASAPKHPVDATTGLLVLASDDVHGRYPTGFLSLNGDAQMPPPPPLPAPPPEITVLVHDTFDQQPLDGPPPGAWFPNTAAPPADGGATIVAAFGGRGQSMLLTSDSAGNSLEYCRAIPLVPDTPVTVTADVKVSAIGTADAHLLSIAGGGPIASIRVTNKGQIGFLTPVGRLRLGALPLDVFVRVRVTVDPLTRTYFVTVSPRDGGPALLALEGQPWAGSRLDAADEACVQTGSGVPGLKLVLDEFLVTKG